MHLYIAHILFFSFVVSSRCFERSNRRCVILKCTEHDGQRCSSFLVFSDRRNSKQGNSESLSGIELRWLSRTPLDLFRSLVTRFIGRCRFMLRSVCFQYREREIYLRRSARTVGGANIQRGKLARQACNTIDARVLSNLSGFSNRTSFERDFFFNRVDHLEASRSSRNGFPSRHSAALKLRG